MRRIAEDRRAAIVALALLTLVWGYNWVVIKIAVRDASPFVFAATRTFGGGCALAAGALLARKPVRSPHWRTFIWIGLFQTAAFVGLVTWAIVSAGAGQVAMLSYTMPLWVALVAWPALGERLRWPQAFAIAVAFAGIACMVGPLRHGAVPSMLALLAGIAWALGVILTKRVQRNRNVDLYALTMWQMLAGGAALVIVALLVPERPTQWTQPYILALCYNVFLATALAYVVWTFVLEKLPARTASMGTLTNPIFGTLAAWAQLHEIPTKFEGAGMILVACGLTALALADHRERVPRDSQEESCGVDTVT